MLDIVLSASSNKDCTVAFLLLPVVGTTSCQRNHENDFVGQGVSGYISRRINHTQCTKNLRDIALEYASELKRRAPLLQPNGEQRCGQAGG